MGLSTTAALENLLARTETIGVRMFVRSIIQGETLGVSMGQIMRNLALEMRKRRKAAAEEGSEGTGQDAVPAHLPDLPGDVRRAAPAGDDHDRQDADQKASDAEARDALTLRREDGRIVCESVRVADTTLRRMRGCWPLRLATR